MMLQAAHKEYIIFELLCKYDQKISISFETTEILAAHLLCAYVCMCVFECGVIC